MAAWSSLALRCNHLTKNAVHLLRNGLKGKVTNVVPVRHSHDRTLQIRSSTFTYYKLKNLIHMYLVVGILPIVLLVSYVNIFIGPAQLALIPEGYEPEPWEYHKHPITRFFAKYLTPSPQEVHEKNMYYMFFNNEITRVRQLEMKVKKLMRERDDYQAWYFEPTAVEYRRRDIELSDQVHEEGFRRGKSLLP